MKLLVRSDNYLCGDEVIVYQCGAKIMCQPTSLLFRNNKKYTQ